MAKDAGNAGSGATVGPCSAVVKTADGIGECRCDGWYGSWVDSHGWVLCQCGHSPCMHAVVPVEAPETVGATG